MSIQHVDQYITSLYDMDQPHWATQESRYASQYLRFLTGALAKPPPVPNRGMRSKGRDRMFRYIRGRVERELAR